MEPVTSAVRIIDDLIKEAFEAGASDIHLHPGDGSLIARFRVNGTLSDIRRFPSELRRELLARLKILANLRIDEHHAPQDGRFSLNLPSAYVDIRLSLMPTYFGEQAVLRLLYQRGDLVTLGDLGFSTIHQHSVLDAIARPHGLILVTGPTGSGKTTTLYTLLRLLNERQVSIITIEDPVEYTLDGVSHIAANEAGGLTFAEGLRSIVRQDPDIIAIGEIRDRESAELAIHAALTGHLVLSTLHTNDAATALLRLIDLGIEPYLVASTVELVIAQRLVRRADRPGRIGLFEALELDDELRSRISSGKTGAELIAYAMRSGFAPLSVDAKVKAGKGLVEKESITPYLYA